MRRKFFTYRCTYVGNFVFVRWVWTWITLQNTSLIKNYISWQFRNLEIIKNIYAAYKIIWKVDYFIKNKSLFNSALMLGHPVLNICAILISICESPTDCTRIIQEPVFHYTHRFKRSALSGLAGMMIFLL